MEDINNSIAQAGDQAQGLIPMQMQSDTPPQMPQSLFGQGQQPSLSDWLMQQAEPTDEPVSLDTLSQDEIDKIMTSVKDGIAVSKEYYESVVEPKLIDRQRLVKADQKLYKEKFPQLSERSKFVSYDIANVIDWIKPSLVEVFTGSESPVTIAGNTIENDDTATTLQRLIEYQLTRKNNYTSLINDVVTDGLGLNLGVSKCWWKREEKRDHYKMMFNIADVQTAIMLTEATLSGDIEITDISSIKDADDLYKVEFDHVKLISNYPVVEYVPPTELRFTPEESSIQQCKFVAHRKIVKGDYLKRKEADGDFKNVDEALEKTGDTTYTAADIYNNPVLTQPKMQATDSDNASKDVELYECYLKVDYNDDGIYEYLIVHCVGDTPLSIQTNEFGIAPFFTISATRDNRRIFPEEGFAEQLEPLQDLKTALIRQIIINVAKNNDRQSFINYSKIDADALFAGEEYVPTKDDPSTVIYSVPQYQISEMAMSMIEYAETEVENRSGSTKYNQGLDANSLNKTATGLTAILGQSDKRIKLMARLIAESWIIPMVRFLILLNQKYGEPVQTFPYKGQNLSISNSDMDMDVDLVINVGDGAGTKEARIQSYMALLANVFPTLGAQGVATPNSYYEAGSALLEEMGLKNTSGILLDPSSDEAKQQQQQVQQQAVQLAAIKYQAQLEAQLAVEQMKNEGKLAVAQTPSVRANLDDLPPNTQMQIMNANAATNVTPMDIAEKELLKRVGTIQNPLGTPTGQNSGAGPSIQGQQQPQTISGGTSPTGTTSGQS
ncbi:hypothetical protein NXG27_00930 [Megasphaera paucivorans]|nr:hypothetical protein [Megasphaera paucivorans]